MPGTQSQLCHPSWFYLQDLAPCLAHSLMPPSFANPTKTLLLNHSSKLPPGLPDAQWGSLTTPEVVTHSSHAGRSLSRLLRALK